MNAVRDLSNHIVGWMAGDVLYNAQGDVSAFVRGSEVFTFCQRHIGRYERGLFRSMTGEPVGTVGVAAERSHFRQRRRRFQITPWLRFSLPAPPPKMTRTWAIWDHAIDMLSA